MHEGRIITGSEKRIDILLSPISTSGQILSTVHIRSIRLEDAGQYTVTASNDDANGTVSFMITVLGM